jgi:hypothetical protein
MCMSSQTSKVRVTTHKLSRSKTQDLLLMFGALTVLCIFSPVIFALKTIHLVSSSTYYTTFIALHYKVR